MKVIDNSMLIRLHLYSCPITLLPSQGSVFATEKISTVFSFSFYMCCLCACLPKEEKSSKINTFSFGVRSKKIFVYNIFCVLIFINEHVYVVYEALNSCLFILFRCLRTIPESLHWTLQVPVHHFSTVERLSLLLLLKWGEPENRHP